MIHVHMTEVQRQELEAMSRHAIGRVALRAHMILLSDRGYSVPQIATIHSCGTDVVRSWLHRDTQQGVAGLEDQARSGRPPKDRQAESIVDAQASPSPALLGPDPGVLECGAAGRVPGAPVPPGALPLQRAAQSAPPGLALGPSPPGTGPQG